MTAEIAEGRSNEDAGGDTGWTGWIPEARSTGGEAFGGQVRQWVIAQDMAMLGAREM